MNTNTHNLSDNAEDRDDRRRRAGRLIAQIRKDEGLSQEQFAKRLYKTRSVVGSAETGREISKPFIEALQSAYSPQYAERIREIAALSHTTPSSDTDSAREEDDDHEMFMRRATAGRRIEGRWSALWEATTQFEAVPNTENITIRAGRSGLIVIQNDEVSAENPEGGYLWRAEGRLFDNKYFLGTYIPRDPEVQSKGCLYLVVHPSGKYLNGQWIGNSYDGDWGRGLVVFAKTPEKLPELLKRHRNQLPALPYERSPSA